MEFSLMLVIIGLIAGAIVFGKQLILAHEVQLQIAQLQAFDTAVLNFKIKYRCLPGDCVMAERYGLGQPGDGSRVIDGPYIDDEHRLNQPEMIEFWRHLSKSGFVKESYPGYILQGMLAAPGVHTPALKLEGHGQFNYETSGADGFNAKGGIMVISINHSTNSYCLFNHDESCAPSLQSAGYDDPNAPIKHAWYLASGSNYTGKAGLYTGLELNAIDRKIDDGYPKSGRMVSFVWGLPYISPLYSTHFWTTEGNMQDVCLDDTVMPPVYNVNSEMPKPDAVCATVIQAEF